MQRQGPVPVEGRWDVVVVWLLKVGRVVDGWATYVLRHVEIAVEAGTVGQRGVEAEEGQGNTESDTMITP